MPTSIDELQIELQGTAKGANASVNALVKNLDNLQSRISKLDTSKFKTLSINTSNLSANTQKLSSSFNALSNSATKSKKSVTSLASAFGTLYANFFWVQRAFSGLMSSIESTSNYLEAYNFFDVSLTKIGKDWASQWEEYGYENAESYVESFKTRLNDDLKKLSGVQIQINADGTGLLSETGLKNLGLNVEEVTQYMARLASVTNSVGQTGETSLAVSSAFSKLAGDISSLFNIDYSTAATNLQSGLIGQSRALYKYGIDITNATLQTYAYELGLEKAVSEMTQAEKMQLRMIAILDQSKVAWGDLANTINQPANAMRVFENQLSELSQLIGQLFIPLVSKVVPILSGITIAIKSLVSTIAGFFGITLEISDSSQGTNDLEDSFYDVEDAVDSATDSVKKLKTATLGIDELNINAPQETSTSTGTTGTGGSTIDLTDEILKATEEYQKEWNEALAQMEDRAGQFAEKVKKALEPVTKLFYDISIGDWFAVGEDTSNIVVGINEFLTKAIASVDWQAVGNNIGLFLAGINWTEAFSSFGELFWEAINSAIEIYKGIFDAAPIETGIITGILVLKFTGVGKIIASKIASSIALNLGTPFITTISAGLKSLFGSEAAKSALVFMFDDFVKTALVGLEFAIPITLGISALTVEWNIEKELEELKEKIEQYGEEVGRIEAGTGIFDKAALGRYDTENANSAVNSVYADWFTDLSDKASTFFSDWGEKINVFQSETAESNDKVSQSYADMFASIGKKMSLYQTDTEEANNSINQVYADAFFDIKTKFENWKTNALNTIEKFKTDSSTKFNTWKTNVETTISDWKINAESKFSTWKINTSNTISTWKTNAENSFSNFKTNTQTTISKWYNKISSFFGFDKWNFTEIKKGLSESFDNAIKSIKEIWNEFANWLNEKLTWTIDPVKVAGKTLFEGTTISLGKIPTFQTFQTGGFPEDGFFFANHSELVGQFSNGKTAVANNEQIVVGIERGVERAVTNVLAPYLADIAQNTRETADKEFATYIGDREIARANERGRRSMGYQLITT